MVAEKDKILFDFIDNLFSKRTKVLSTTAIPSTFVMAKFFGSNLRTFAIARLCGYWAGKVPDWAIGAALYHVIPKARATPRFYWAKEKTKELDDELCGLISQTMSYSMKSARQILQVLQLQGVDVNSIFGRKAGKHGKDE